jgi:hypothetical protein
MSSGASPVLASVQRVLRRDALSSHTSAPIRVVMILLGAITFKSVTSATKRACRLRRRRGNQLAVSRMTSAHRAAALARSLVELRT